MLAFLISIWFIISAICFKICYVKSGLKYGLDGFFLWPFAVIYGLLSGQMWKDVKEGFAEGKRKE